MLPRAEFGCLISHYNVLLNTRSELTLILEDDFELCDDFDEKLVKCLNELPSDFNGLWLGGRRLVGKGKEYSENLLSISGITGTYGYIIHRRFIGKCLAALEKKNKLADWALSSVFEKVYKSKENLVKHKDGYSEIKKQFVSYKDLR